MAPLDSKQHELLSVYLDGETTPAEKAEVERWIEKDAEARRLLAELRAVREDVGGLPAPTLDPGFGAELLQRIESETSAEQPEPSEEAEPRTFDWRRLRDRFLNARSLAYAGLTVAVAVLLMLLAPPDDRETARVRDKSQPVDRMEADAASEIPAMSAAPEESARSNRAVESVEREEVKDAEGKAAPLAAEPVPVRATPPPPMERLAPTAPATEAPAMKAMEAESVPASGPARVGTTDGLKKLPSAYGVHGGVPKGGMAGAAPKGMPAVPVLDEESTNRGLRRSAGDFVANNAPVDVVRFGVTQKAVDEGAVRRLLVSNSIEIQDSGKIAKGPADQPANRRGRQTSKSEAKAANEIVVVIEAESPNLEGFLSDVANQPQQFPPRMTPYFGKGGGMGFQMEGRMVPGMDGQIRPARASGPSGPGGASPGNGLAAGRWPVPTEGETRKMSKTGSDKRLGIAADEQGERKKADKPRRFEWAAPADAARAPRGQAIILTEPEVPEPLDFAQSNLQSDTLFRRGAAVEAGKPGDPRPPINLGMKAATLDEKPRALRQAIVVFEIVSPPPLAIAPAQPVEPAAPAKPVEPARPATPAMPGKTP